MSGGESEGKRAGEIKEKNKMKERERGGKMCRKEEQLDRA